MIRILASLFMLAVLLVSLSLWGWVAGKIWRREQLLPIEPRRAVPWGLLDVILALLIWFVIGMCAMQLLIASGVPAPKAETLPEPRHLALQLFVSGLTSLLALACSACVMKLRTKATWQDLGLVPAKLLGDVLLGMLAFVMIAPPVYALQMVLVQFFPQFHPLINLLRESPDVRIFLASGLSVCVSAPLLEEYLFRGLLQGWLEALRRGVTMDEVLLGVKPAEVIVASPMPQEEAVAPYVAGNAEIDNPAVLLATTLPTDTYGQGTPANYSVSRWPTFVSAALFALAHYSHGPAPIPLFFLALGLGYLYQRTHRLTPCIVVHFLLNSWTMVLLLIEVYLPMPKP